MREVRRADPWTGLPPAASIQHTLVRQLQRTQDNAHVQRVLAHRQAAPSPQGSPVIAREPVPPADPALLAAFAADFPDSAALIRKSAEALKLITEAEGAGCKYGGFSEDGPGKATLGA